MPMIKSTIELESNKKANEAKLIIMIEEIDAESKEKNMVLNEYTLN